MRLNKRKRNKSFSNKTDIKSTEMEAMVLQHSVSQSLPNHFQHSNDNIGRKFAGSRFSDAPSPSLLPKPPDHWIFANNVRDRDPIIYPTNSLQTNAIQNIKDIQNIQNIESLSLNGLSFNSSDYKRNKSDDKVFELKLSQILDINSVLNNCVVNNSANYGNNRVFVRE